MDKLQPQTVYVPVSVNERLPEGADPVIALNTNGGSGMTKPFIVSGSTTLTHWLEQLPGVYVLTGKELADLLTEYEYSLHGNSTSFLKEKGVEI